jgi:hypothetical protein
MTVAESERDDATALLQSVAPGAQLTYALGGSLRFELPRGGASASRVFGALEGARQRLRLVDFSVANATLEEVFIRLARQHGAYMAERA